jgi:hypothetical protein
MTSLLSWQQCPRAAKYKYIKLYARLRGKTRNLCFRIGQQPTKQWASFFYFYFPSQ